MAQARFSTDRALSGVYPGQSQLFSDGPKDMGGSRFCDSLKALLGPQNDSDSQPEVNGSARDSASPSSISADANAPNGLGAKPDFVSIAADAATSLAAVVKHPAKGLHAKLVLSTAAQRQLPGTTETKSSVVMSNRKSVANRTTTDDGADNGAAQIVMTMVPAQVPAVTAPIPDKQTGSLEIAIPASVQNKAIAAELPIDAPRSSGVSVLSRNPEKGLEEGETPNARSISGAGIRRTPSQIDEGGSPKVNGGQRTEPVDGHLAPVPTRAPASPRPDASSGPSTNKDEGQSGANNEISSAAWNVSEEQSRVQRGERSIAKQEGVIDPQRGPNAAQMGLLNQERSIDANGGSVQAVPGPAVVEAARTLEHASDSTPWSLTSGMDRFGRTAGRAKSLSSRSDQTVAPSQDLKHVPADSAIAYAPRSSEMCRVAEVANGGSTHPNSIETSSSDGRLQNTFSALEAEARGAASAFEGIRTGRMQAEAGYHDPALGWIGIRAEASGGAIHATLISQSSDAAQVLGGHVAGMHTYLAENRTPVETLSLASSGGNAQQFSGHPSGQEAQQHSRQNARQDDAQGAATETQRVSASGISGTIRTVSTSSGLFASSHSNIGPGGGRISVLA